MPLRSIQASSNGLSCTLTYGEWWVEHIEPTARMEGWLREASGREPTGFSLHSCERCNGVAGVPVLVGDDGHEPTHCVQVCCVCHHVGVWDYSIDDWINGEPHARVLATLGLPPEHEYPSLDQCSIDLSGCRLREWLEINRSNYE